MNDNDTKILQFLFQAHTDYGPIRYDYFDETDLKYLKIVQIRNLTKILIKYFQNLVQSDSTNLLTKPRVKFVRREVSVLLPVLLPVQNVILD